MGLLTEKLIKDVNKRYLVLMIMDVVLIIALLYFSFKIKGEWQKGFDECKKQACAVCGAFNQVNMTPFTNITSDVVNTPPLNISP